jgi:ATP-dependent HslUV protease subunit HslV
VVAVRRADQLAMAGDGQVTVGDMVLKHSARKLRRLAGDRVLAGFAGAVADALTLFEKFEGHLSAHQGHLRRAAVELAREWRTDRYLRRLEAHLLIGDLESLLILSGEGDVLEPDEGVAAIGSGSPYAIAAARALLAHTDQTAAQVAEASMAITSDLCIYTNRHIILETIERAPGSPTG